MTRRDPTQGQANQPQPPVLGTEESLVIPVVTEDVAIRKEKHISGRVRITKTVHDREALLEETVQREEVNVERVAINRVVDEVSEQYYEGETLVIPIYTEVLVVEKRLMLAEELRITKQRYEQPVQEHVTLRDEEVKVERLDDSN
ncbi:MAG: YsnF/AvaK domain-containing protein [Caldilineaceae bacterium]|nr:YsnF/AvaK domain-containing protein [Caldilineaceae bacterium]